jgi:hypothetical protein
LEDRRAARQQHVVIDGCERDQTDVSGLTTALAIFEDDAIGEASVLESGDLDQHGMPTEAASDQALEPARSGLMSKSVRGNVLE